MLSCLSCDTASEYHQFVVAATVSESGLNVKPDLIALLLSLFDIPAYWGIESPMFEWHISCCPEGIECHQFERN